MTPDYSEYLPEPTPWRTSAVVGFQWGNESFTVLCVAGDVRVEPYEGNPVTWLHFKGRQFFGAVPTDLSTSVTTYMAPASYVTKIEPGPPYKVSQGKKTVDIGVFPPMLPDPPGSIGIEEVQRLVVELLTPERN